ncbi:MAG: hypothetical protein EB830_04965 [Nitrosopumilus sp. H13]|nr:MAG: hypothetical protein EB830_04965 [Nitrosopumilus sp. H13]
MYYRLDLEHEKNTSGSAQCLYQILPLNHMDMIADSEHRYDRSTANLFRLHAALLVFVFVHLLAFAATLLGAVAWKSASNDPGSFATYPSVVLLLVAVLVSSYIVWLASRLRRKRMRSAIPDAESRDILFPTAVCAGLATGAIWIWLWSIIP